MSILGAQLRQLRVSANLTQVELATRIRVSQPTVSAVERGAPTTTDVVEAWVEACGGYLVASTERGTALLSAAAQLSSSDLDRVTRVALAIARAPEPFKEHLIQALELFPAAS